MIMRNKVKVEHLYEYWLVYFQNSIRLKRGPWRTVGHALANWILRNATEAQRYKKLEPLGGQLNDMRDYALAKMRENGIEVCLKGKTRIEEISIDKKDIPENDRRAIRRGQQGILATEKKCYGLNRKLRSEYGWLLEGHIKTVKRVLLLGGNTVEVSVKTGPQKAKYEMKATK